MELEREDILHLAKLSKLSLSEEEESLFLKNIRDILQYVEMLKEVDEMEIFDEEAQVSQMKLRKDEVQSSIKREEILKAATYTEDGYFSIPLAEK